MRTLRLMVALLGGSWWLAGAQAQQASEETAPPDLDFLEYLGAWAEDDDEWLAIEEWHKGNADETEDSDPKKPEDERKDDDESE
jgi:hypothetical protein